jgi:Family of unknown function (DUF5947)
MVSALNAQRDQTFAALRQFARKKPIVERCEICSRELLPEHEHLVEPASRKLICACHPCTILFDGRADAKFKRVPRTVQFLQNFQLTDSQWDSLCIPIEMAFFFNSSVQQRVVAFYPSPAGAIESLLPLDTWEDLVAVNPILHGMQSDVVALLANRANAARHSSSTEYFLVPIDECYKLVGLIRMHWRGFSGGSEVWRELDSFFDYLMKKARVNQEVARA